MIWSNDWPNSARRISQRTRACCTKSPGQIESGSSRSSLARRSRQHQRAADAAGPRALRGNFRRAGASTTTAWANACSSPTAAQCQRHARQRRLGTCSKSSTKTTSPCPTARLARKCCSQISANYTQPIIRYEIGDMRHDGDRALRLRQQHAAHRHVEGRDSDVFEIKTDRGTSNACSRRSSNSRSAACWMPASTRLIQEENTQFSHLARAFARQNRSIREQLRKSMHEATAQNTTWTSN